MSENQCPFPSYWRHQNSTGCFQTYLWDPQYKFSNGTVCVRLGVKVGLVRGALSSGPAPPRCTFLPVSSELGESTPGDFTVSLCLYCSNTKNLTHQIKNVSQINTSSLDNSQVSVQCGSVEDSGTKQKTPVCPCDFLRTLIHLIQLHSSL